MQTPRLRSGRQNASGRRTRSGGHDEDHAVFCAQRRVDPERDQPHVSEVCSLKAGFGRVGAHSHTDEGVWTLYVTLGGHCFGRVLKIRSQLFSKGY